MVSYRLSSDTRLDLQRIYRRGVLEFGEAQADRYFEALFDGFQDIADHRDRYPALEEIRAGYPRSVCAVDTIHYFIVDDVAEIMRILDRQDMETQF